MSRAKARVVPAGLIPIRAMAGLIAPTEGIAVTLSLETRVLRLHGSAADLAQLLRCL